MKMLRSTRRHLYWGVLVAFACICWEAFQTQTTVYAATTYYGQSFTPLKSWSKVTVPNASSRMDSEYSFIPNFIDGVTSMKIIGSGTHWGASASPYDNTSIKLDSSLKKGDAGALYSDVGTYQGQKVDLKITLTDWILNPHTDDSVYNLVSFATTLIGINTTGTAVATKWTFLKHNTNTPLNISGYFSFNDLDNGGVGTQNIAGQYALDMFVGSTLQIDQYGNSSTVTNGRLSGFGGAPNMGSNPTGRRHSTPAWQSLRPDNDPLGKGQKLVVQMVETFGSNKRPVFVDSLDAVKVREEAKLQNVPIMIYSEDTTHIVTEEGIAYLYKTSSMAERQAAMEAIAGVQPVGLAFKPSTSR